MENEDRCIELIFDFLKSGGIILHSYSVYDHVNYLNYKHLLFQKIHFANNEYNLRIYVVKEMGELLRYGFKNYRDKLMVYDYCKWRESGPWQKVFEELMQKLEYEDGLRRDRLAETKLLQVVKEKDEHEKLVSDLKKLFG